MGKNDVEIRKYKTFPDFESYTANGFFTATHISEDFKYVEIKNGRAEFYSNIKEFNIYHFVKSKAQQYIGYNYINVDILKNSICTIKLRSVSCDKVYYYGKSAIVLNEYYTIIVNGRPFWIGSISFSTYHMVKKINIGFIDKNLNTQEIKNFELKRYMMPDCTADKYIITLSLEPLIDIGTIQLQYVRPDFEKQNMYASVQNIHDRYFKQAEKLKSVLEEFIVLKDLDIDIESEIEYLFDCPDLIDIICRILEFIISKKNSFNEPKNSKQEIDFHIEANYNRQYYRAAKLADTAKKVEYNEDENKYTIVFQGDQIREIELMYYNLYNPYANDDVEKEKELKDIEKFLKINAYDFFICDFINQYMYDYQKKNGYCGSLTHSVLMHIIKQIEKQKKKELKEIYSLIAKENRIQARWNNEYKLFVLISSMIGDAKYQYSGNWLGQQSLDIYIPSQNVAIEYQGKQHYESIEFFGGDSSLKNNQERDERKKNICKQQGVKLLYWKYDIEVSRENVLNFLNDNGIKCQKSSFLEQNSYNNMAPQKKEREKEKRKRKVTSYVVQYSLDGKFVKKYETIKEASNIVGINPTSIIRAINGEQKTAGNHLWKRYSVEESIPQEIILCDNSSNN